MRNCGSFVASITRELRKNWLPSRPAWTPRPHASIADSASCPARSKSWTELGSLAPIPLATAAPRVGSAPKTARKYRRLGKLPSGVKIMDRDWLTRPDPFAEVWTQIQAQLQLNPGLEAKTLFAD